MNPAGARLALAAILVLVLSTVLLPADGVAAETTAGPTVLLDRAEARAGEKLVVTLTGWAGRAVTLSVCGNLARRGSPDCNIVASQGVGVALDRPTTTDFVVSPPPTTCPCVIRAADATQDQVATAPLLLVGVPVGLVIEPARGPLVDVSVSARKVSTGVIDVMRSKLGGPTSYEVTVKVRNQTMYPLSSIALTGAAGRSRSSGESFAIPSLGRLEPGQTRERVLRATLPAPVVGRFVWQVTASGAGPTVYAEVTSETVPVGLLALTAILLVDFAMMMWRRGGRSRSVKPGQR